MTRSKSRIGWICLVATVAFALLMGSISAQPRSGGMGSKGGMSGPAGGYWDVMGPGMMGRGDMGGMCSPRAAGLTGWRFARTPMRLNKSQRPQLDELLKASTRAVEIIAAACSIELPQSPVARLELMEKRMTAMLEAIKVVRPAFTQFYESLNDYQRDRLGSAGRYWGVQGWSWQEWQKQWQQQQKSEQQLKEQPKQ